MEPITLAASAAALLTPYLVKAYGKAAEKIGENYGSDTGSGGPALAGDYRVFQRQACRRRSCRDLVAKPQEEDNVATFRKELRKMPESDSQFAGELARLLGEAQREPGQAIVSTGSGAVATSGGVAAGEGGVAIRGNVGGDVSAGGNRSKE